MASPSFPSFFNQPGALPARGEFLSRIFGIFSEELVRIWASDDRAPYRDLGRPTLADLQSNQSNTLDFTFQDRVTGKAYVVEMKCEIEYQSYRFLSLTSPTQIDHHKKPAFDQFLRVARDPRALTVKVNRQPLEVDGAILVWGDVPESGRQAVIAERGFHDVIGMNRILNDLWNWQPDAFVAYIASLHAWSSELFVFLSGEEPKMVSVFKNDDAGFVQWRDSHPQGYICNIPYPNVRNEREYHLPHICLHRVGCQSIAQNKNGERPWTTKDYFKLCAEQPQPIKDWVLSEVDIPAGWSVRSCKNCAP